MHRITRHNFMEIPDYWGVFIGDNTENAKTKMEAGYPPVALFEHKNQAQDFCLTNYNGKSVIALVTHKPEE